MTDPTKGLRRVLNALDDRAAACEKGLVVVLFGALAAMIFFNIACRNFLGRSFPGVLEAAPAVVLWLSLLGASLALKSGRHIRLDILLRFCPPGVRRVAAVITGCFGMAVTGLLFYVSLGFVANDVAMFGARGWLSTIFPVFFALSTFRYLIRTFEGTGRPADERSAKGEGSATAQ